MDSRIEGPVLGQSALRLELIDLLGTDAGLVVGGNPSPGDLAPAYGDHFSLAERLPGLVVQRHARHKRNGLVGGLDG